jgi:hypothetical protein
MLVLVARSFLLTLTLSLPGVEGIRGKNFWQTLSLVALGKEHDPCQEFRRLIGESLGFKGESIGVENLGF